MLEIGRGALVVIAGYVLMTVLVIFSSILLGAFFPGPTVDQPSQAYVVGNLACGFLSAVIGGWVTARMAATRPLLHVCVLVALMLGIGLYLTTSEPQPGQPAWYPAVIVVIGSAGALLGGFLRARSVERIT